MKKAWICFLFVSSYLVVSPAWAGIQVSRRWSGGETLPLVCDGATDEGGDALCQDLNACTADACAGAAGCVNTTIDEDADGFLCGFEDCDDSDGSVWATPVEVTNLNMTMSSPANLSWDDQAGVSGTAVVYDVVSGALDAVLGVDLASGSCLDSTAATMHVDTRPDARPTGTSSGAATPARPAPEAAGNEMRRARPCAPEVAGRTYLAW